MADEFAWRTSGRASPGVRPGLIEGEALKPTGKSDRASLDSFDRWGKVALVTQKKLKTNQGRN
jgi:hypothetical protein